MTAAPEPPHDPAEDVVFRCLESGDPDGELAALRARDPELAARAAALLRQLGDDGLLDAGSTAPSLPERLGSYRLDERLGEGGMGIVLSAHDETLGQRVAIKLIRPDMMPFAKSRQRFELEIAALTGLRHPGIARLLDAGEQDGLRFFAMEFVDGESLAQVMSRLQGRRPVDLHGRDLFAGRLAPVDADGPERTDFVACSWIEACVTIVRDVALAVAHAHRQGVLHRDVKPANVMLGKDGRPRLLDFGLARAEGRETMTRTGAALGSLAYMAPEQLAGDRTAVDERTDVYALGVLLFELLTLRAPFLVADDAARTTQRILRGRHSSLRRLHPAVDRRLALVCTRAFARRPGDRYATAAQLAGELDAVLADRPVHGGSRLRRLVQDHPLAVAALAAVATAGLVVVSVAYGFSRKERDAEALARARAETAAGAAATQAERARFSSYAADLHAAQKELALGRLTSARKILEHAPEEHRSWEWHHLLRRTRLAADVHRLTGATGAWHLGANEKHQIAITNGRNRVRLRDPTSGRLHEPLRAELDTEATKSSLASNGAAYAFVRERRPRELQVCDLEQISTRVLRFERDLTGVAVSPDRRRAVLRDADGRLTVLDVESGRELPLADAVPRSRNPLVSPSGARFAVQLGPELVVFDLDDRRELWRRRLEFDWLTALAFLPGGDELCAVSAHAYLEVFDSRSGERTDEMRTARWPELGGAWIRTLACDPDGEHLWLTAYDGLLHCLHLPTRRWTATIPGSPLRWGRAPFVPTLAVDPHRQRLLASTVHGEVWDHDLRALRSGWLACGGGSLHAARNTRGDVLVARTGAAPVLRGRGDETRTLSKLPAAHRAAFVDLRLAVLAPVRSGALLVYDLDEDRVVRRLEGHARPVRALATVGGRLVSGAEDGSLRVWDVAGGRCVSELPGHEKTVTALAGLPGGRRVASAGLDGDVAVTDIVTGTRTTVLRGEPELFAVAASPDGRWLAAGGAAAGVKLVDLQAGRPLPVEISDWPTSGLAFTADGRRLLQSSYRASLVRIYAVGTWREVVMLEPHHGAAIHQCDFAADGSTLLTSDAGGLVRIRGRD